MWPPLHDFFSSILHSTSKQKKHQHANSSLNKIASRKNLSNSHWLHNVRELHHILEKYKKGDFTFLTRVSLVTTDLFNKFEVINLKKCASFASRILKPYLKVGAESSNAQLSQLVNPVIYFTGFCTKNFIFKGITAPTFVDGVTVMSKNSTKDKLVDFILNELRKESNMVLISNTHRGFNGHTGDGRVCKLEIVTEWIDLRKKTDHQNPKCILRPTWYTV
jgi:predicted DNA-binding protein YlxM (UPF0122 family)